METLTENSLIVYLDNNKVEPETKTSLLQNFETFFNQAQEWKEKAEGLVITSADQREEIKQASVARKALKEIRVNTEHKRKELKEESLRKGQTIDAIAKIITNQILPIEEHLEKQEKFIEIQEAKRKAELKETRLAQLAQYDVDGELFDLGNMPEMNFAQFLDNSRIAHEAKIQAALIAETERIAAEKAEAEARAEQTRIEAEERERIRIENEKLKKEAEEREKAIEDERKKNAEIQREQELKAQKEREAAALEARKILEAHEAKIKAEREERERLENELKAKHEAESRKILEEAERAEAELSKGDKAKFLSLIADIESLKTKYSFKSKKHNALQASVNELLTKTITYANSKV